MSRLTPCLRRRRRRGAARSPPAARPRPRRRHRRRRAADHVGHAHGLHQPALRAVRVQGERQGRRARHATSSRQVADDLGVTMTPVETGFDGIQSGAALDAGTCDVVASAITITESAQASSTSPSPYFDANQGLLVPSGSGLDSPREPRGQEGRRAAGHHRRDLRQGQRPGDGLVRGPRPAGPGAARTARSTRSSTTSRSSAPVRRRRLRDRHRVPRRVSSTASA